MESVGLGNPNITATVEGDTIILKGEVASQEEKEKIILAAGNVAGVASVDDQITVTGPVAQAARFVTVEKGEYVERDFVRRCMATLTSTRRSSRPTNRCSSTRTRSIRGRCCVFLTDLCSLYRPLRG
ncbi:LysM domain/BON superfamily protein [Pseudomonas putida S11]|nr:LysM domain/BON superfamily protein [Pseudomonas putida S11]